MAFYNPRGYYTLDEPKRADEKEINLKNSQSLAYLTKRGKMTSTKFHIPFTIANLNKLKRRSKFFFARIKYKKDTKFGEYLKKSDVEISREEYLAIAMTTFCLAFAILFVISTTVLAILGVSWFFLYGFGLAGVFSLFILFSQIAYPRVYVAKKQRNIEKNLIPALGDIYIQLNSGIPLFNILVNVSSSDYGELSEEFKKAVKRINSGEPEAAVLDDIGKKNPSVFFRRTLWQISSGMKSGSDLSIVIEESAKALNEEQLIQIQSYGNKLNPLIVFYMLVAVIIPALSITFLTIISSMINLDGRMAMMLFIGLFVFIILIQIIFLGVIKSRRPSLL